MRIAEIGAFLNPFGETLSSIFVVSLITDYANIFEAEGRARADKLKHEIEVGVAA